MGALLLSSQLELLLPGRQFEETWLRAIGTVALPLGVVWLVEDVLLSGPSLPALRDVTGIATTLVVRWFTTSTLVAAA